MRLSRATNKPKPHTLTTYTYGNQQISLTLTVRQWL